MRGSGWAELAMDQVPLKSDNPYVATEVPLHVPQSQYDVTLVLATKTQRFLTFIIDLVARLLCLAVFIFAIVLALPETSEWFEMKSRWQEWAVDIVSLILFYMMFESIWGRTPGKWVMRTRVVQLDGTDPTPWQILRRTLARWIPFEPFSFLGAKPFGWHDSMSDTRVVSLKKLEALESGDTALLESERAKWFKPDYPVASVEPANWKQMSEAQQAIWTMQQEADKRERGKKEVA
jgi:uncharacterized RDD family membrane protein YckC